MGIVNVTTYIDERVNEMKKDVQHRIAYYTRKVAQKSAIHPSQKPPRAHTYRHQRLMNYKAAMMREIEKYQADRRG